MRSTFGPHRLSLGPGHGISVFNPAAKEYKEQDADTLGVRVFA